MIILALDTASETVAVAVAEMPEMIHLPVDYPSFQQFLIESIAEPAPRCANTRLLTIIDEMFSSHALISSDIGAVVCGRGPGSFTGVRIGVATAKGLATGRHVPLYGVSTLDAIAWSAWEAGLRGTIGVVADALRKEIYPVRFSLSASGLTRLEVDAVSKPDMVAERWARQAAASGTHITLLGDGLHKYLHEFESAFASADAMPYLSFATEQFWAPQGSGLLLAHYDLIARGKQGSGDPGLLLPVYTRLSDAEENERLRLSSTGEVMQGVLIDTVETSRQVFSYETSTVEDVSVTGVAENQAAGGVLYRPLSRNDLVQVTAIEHALFGHSAWSVGMFEDELGRNDRTWWVAVLDGGVVGYCGGWVIDGVLNILHLATVSAVRRKGVATALMQRVCHDGIDLGATGITLEVRVSNTSAIELYVSLGMVEVGRRKQYYTPFQEGGSREDGLILSGDLVVVEKAAAARIRRAVADGKPWLAGMELERRATVTAHSDVCTSRPLILAIESSCDETAAAVIDGHGDLVADVVASQIDFHARFGGVVPEIASRKHTEAIVGVIEETMSRAGQQIENRESALPLGYRQLDAIAVTQGPGLIGALVVGVAFAKGLSWVTGVPLIGVNHLEGHIYANRIANPSIEPPFVVGLLSGGHTMLVHVRDWHKYEVLGETLDDAVGEAFDKVSKALGLGYPGGPIISRYAAKGNPQAIAFPRAMLHSGDYTFSLSGLKTAVITYIRRENDAGRALNIPDVAASFQQAVIDVQVAKALAACQETGCREFCLGGGVAANKALRDECVRRMENVGIHVTLPPLVACTDNASMIARVALDTFMAGPDATKRADGLGGFLGLTSDATAHFPL